MVCRDTPSSFPKAPWESARSSRRCRITLRMCQACFTLRQVSSLLYIACEFPRNLEFLRASGANSHTMRNMRGEYKVPGGKLVAVDVTVEEDRLAKVSLSGDFFLEPDDALEQIDRALTGLPASSSVAELTAAITAVLNDSIAMIGFSPEAIGIAVRRALGKATSWHDHTFEVIHEDPVHPAIHVALDEVIANEVGKGNRGPTLRFWEWNAPAVVIGSFQSL